MAETPLSSWLRKLREKRGVPLRVVAAAVEMDSTLLSKLECGERVPTDAQAQALRRFYRVSALDMSRRVVAARILQAHGGDPALAGALSLVREKTKLLTASTAKQKEPTGKRPRTNPCGKHKPH